MIAAYRRVGGLRFVRLGSLCASWCVTTRPLGEGWLRLDERHQRITECILMGVGMFAAAALACL